VAGVRLFIGGTQGYGGEVARSNRIRKNGKKGLGRPTEGAVRDWREGKKLRC